MGLGNSSDASRDDWLADGIRATVMKRTGSITQNKSEPTPRWSSPRGRCENTTRDDCIHDYFIRNRSVSFHFVSFRLHSGSSWLDCSTSSSDQHHQNVLSDLLKRAMMLMILSSRATTTTTRFSPPPRARSYGKNRRIPSNRFLWIAAAAATLAQSQPANGSTRKTLCKSFDAVAARELQQKLKISQLQKCWPDIIASQNTKLFVAATSPRIFVVVCLLKY